MGAVLGISLLASWVHAAEPAGRSVEVASAEDGENVDSAAPRPGSPKESSDPSQENWERNVDSAALSAQIESEQNLKAVVAGARGSEQEPHLLFKLAEIEQQTAAMLFRVDKGGAAHHLGDYKVELQSSVAILTELVQRFPRHPRIETIYFMRAKANEELDRKDAAIRDYLYLVTNYPRAEQLTSAYMALAELAIESEQHAQALKYLAQVERHPRDSRYPFALFKSAWSNYSLGHVREALAYAESLVRYYDAKGAGIGSTEDSIRESILSDSAVFFFDGYERGLPGFTSADALRYFRKVGRRNSAILGRMELRYAKLLRAHEYAEDLAKWRDLIVGTEPLREQTLTVAITAFEFQLNKHLRQPMLKSAGDVVKVAQSGLRRGMVQEDLTTAQKLLNDAATQIQGEMIRNKDVAGAPEKLGAQLAIVYDAFLSIVSKNDPRVRIVHANLAETLFAIGEFEKAVQQYRWIVLHGNWSEKPAPKTVTVAQASVRAISARYETLRKKGWVPGELKASLPTQTEAAALPMLLDQWLAWIDEHTAKSTDASGAAIDNFAFEANRTLYARGYIRHALPRLESFALRNPSSKFAIPSATLVLDTEIAMADWASVESLASRAVAQKSWKGTAFGSKLEGLAADAGFKQVEAQAKAQRSAPAIAMAENFLARYPNSPRTRDALSVAGNAALALKDYPLAQQYFERLAHADPHSSLAAKALLAVGGIEENRFEFNRAVSSYQSYLRLPAAVSAKELASLRKRIVMLSWLGGDAAQWTQVSRDRKLCGSKDLAELCSRQQSLSKLSAPFATPSALKAGVKQAQTSGLPQDLRAISAARALETAGSLSFGERDAMSVQLAALWPQLDATTRFMLLPSVSRTVPAAFALNRASIAKVSKLESRIKVMKEFETAATQTASLPWIRIRAGLLNEVADLYADLANTIRNMPPTRALSGAERIAYQTAAARSAAPFDQKSMTVRAKAFQLVSRNSVESEVYQPVADAYFRARGIEPKAQSGEKSELTTDLLASAANGGDDKAHALVGAWQKALTAGTWNQVAFFMQESTARGLLSARGLAISRAVSLASAGAQAEGYMALDSAPSKSRSAAGRAPKRKR